MSRVVHFEIAVDVPDRAATFYNAVFGWKIDKWEGPQDCWLVTTGPDEEPGINGALTKRGQSAAPTVNTISVSSVDETMEKIRESGGSVLSGKMTIPGIGYHAYCKDTEGNVFGIIEEDTSAA